MKSSLRREKRTPQAREFLTVSQFSSSRSRSSNKTSKQTITSEALASDEENPYSKFRSKLRTLLINFRRDNFALTVYDQDASRGAGSKKTAQLIEPANLENRIQETKQEIRALLKELTDMHSSGPRWGHISPDENGEIDLEIVECTICSSAESYEDNDILLCDNEGCFRAYHQQCIVPRVPNSIMNDENSDWNCWQCQCLIECLELMEQEFEGSTFDRWQDVFPECGDGVTAEVLENEAPEEEETDPSSDEDFLPKSMKQVEENLSIEHDSAASIVTGDKSEDDSDDTLDGGSIDTETSLDSIGDGNSEIAGLSDVSFDSTGFVEGPKEERPTTIGQRVNARKVRLQAMTQKIDNISVSGSDDIGRRIAQVKGGYLYKGEIIDFVPETSSNEKAWRCSVRNTTVEMGEEEVIASLKLWETEDLRQQQYEKSERKAKRIQELLDKKGATDIKNIINQPRKKKIVDYVALNEAYFGDFQHEDIDDGHEEYPIASNKKTSRKKRKLEKNNDTAEIQTKNSINDIEKIVIKDDIATEDAEAMDVANYEVVVGSRSRPISNTRRGAQENRNRKKINPKEAALTN